MPSFQREYKRKTKTMVVIFSSLITRYNNYFFEFRESFKDYNYHKLFMKDLNALFYISGIDREKNSIEKVRDFLDIEIKKKKPKKIIFLGHSSGGYASILFSNIVNFDSDIFVVSFSPQTMLGSKNMMNLNDERWSEYMKKIDKKNIDEKYLDLSKSIDSSKDIKYNFVYDSTFVNDENHVKNIINNLSDKTYNLYKFDFGAHMLVGILRKKDILKPLIQKILNE